MKLNDWPVERLAEQCEKETKKYLWKFRSNSSFCYELFKKAIEKQSEIALNFIYSIYRPQVLNWIRKHPSRNLIIYEDENLFFDIMSLFWGGADPLKTLLAPLLPPRASRQPFFWRYGYRYGG